MIQKNCTKCGNLFTENDFVKHYVKKDGRQAWKPTCRSCQNKQNRAWQRANPEKYKAQRARSYIATKIAHPDFQFQRGLRHILKRVNLTLEEYIRVLKKQNGVCAICGNPETSPRYKRLTIDHNHITGEFRGLLCHVCNRGLGLFKDDPILTKAATAYLRR